ncbi:hypothetical protein [Dactylosporangium sp. NPDC049140]|uniref:hypothetical protein n=1 Tax=Dactylosporangium sp. NPDC049140 TaxID=3155647 RepID=UPI0033E19354
MRVWKLTAVFAVVAAMSVALAQSAYAGNGSTKYTHPSALTQASCTILANRPGEGVVDWGWPKEQRSLRGATYHVGVRYTVGDYALVLDLARKAEPSWGFIARSCLTDPYAYDAAGHRLPDLRAVGGNSKTKDVRPEAPHAGKRARTTPLHVGAGAVGTLRNAGKSFVIGNVREGDPFYITKAKCGKHQPTAWILGYAPSSGRWGYVEAKHLPACL